MDGASRVRKPLTSVIIPAYRARATLPAVLDALEPQMTSNREAILVDSSGDGFCSKLAQQRPWLSVIAVPERVFPGKARNLGAAQAQGELLAFLDADAVPSPGWLDQLERAMSSNVDAVCGAVLNGTPGSSVGTADYLLTFSETLPARPRPIRHAPSANLIVWREWFEAAGGFQPRLRAGEDTMMTFPLACRWRLGFAAQATVTHLNRTALGPFLANQRRQGAAFVSVCRVLPYPNRWVCSGGALLLAGPLRLVALGRLVLYNRSHLAPALRALPALALGTGAWVAGAFEERRRLQVT